MSTPGMSAADAVLINDHAFKQRTHARFAELRARGPVHLVRQPDGLELYAVLDHAVARTALAHPDLAKNPAIAEAALAAAGNTSYRGGQGFGGNMITADPPDHARLRGPVAKAFTPQRVQALAPRIQEMTDGLVDALLTAGQEQVDLVAAFTSQLPMMVICELFGVPREQRPQLRQWTAQAFVGGSTPEVRQASLRGINESLAALIAAKRKQPTEDLLSALITAGEADGGALSEAELLGTAVLMIVAGHETTVNLLGNAVAALLQHPDQAALLRAEPERLPAAVEEFLRYDAPVEQTPLRFAQRDLELGGVLVPAGSPVTVVLASVGRDGTVTPDAERLDVTRTDGRHLSFGHGIHYCLGAPLARLEAVIGIGTLLRRLPGLLPAYDADELLWTPAGMMHGPLRLPVLIGAT